MLAAGEPVPGIDAVTRSKLRRLLAERSLWSLRAKLAPRAERRNLRAHSSDLDRIEAEPGMIPTGPRAASAARLSLIGGDAPLQFYVDEGLAPKLARRYVMRESRHPNVVLRVVPDEPFSWLRGPVAPALARLPLPDAVLFDLDGTLVDTVETRISSWVEALEEAGLPTTRERLAPLIGVDGKRLAREIATLAGVALDEARAEAIDRRSGEMFERLNHAPRPLPGVRDLVAAIEARRIRWAIATSSRMAQVATSVAALALDTEPSIVDASHVEHAKPEPDLLLLAAHQLEVEPARCWYVGDSTWDMVAAVAAGMIPIGVTAGAGVDERALRDAGAAVVVGTLIDLAQSLAVPHGSG